MPFVKAAAGLHEGISCFLGKQLGPWHLHMEGTEMMGTSQLSTSFFWSNHGFFRLSSVLTAHVHWLLPPQVRALKGTRPAVASTTLRVIAAGTPVAPQGSISRPCVGPACLLMEAPCDPRRPLSLRVRPR